MSYDTNTQDPGSASSAEQLKNTVQKTVTVNEEYAKEVGKQLAEDWDKEMAVELLSPDVTKDAVTTPAYFTDGEMLPWKGRWFRVKLLEIDGQKMIGLSMMRATSKATKRAKREQRWQRWQRNHPSATAPRPGSRLPFTPQGSSPASA